MQTLSYGFQLPETNDRGSALWTALEDDIQQINDHTHNGTDSAKLSVQNFTTTSQTITNAGWATYGGPTGYYRQLVNIPAGFDYDDFNIAFKDSTSKEKLSITIQRVTNTSFYVYSNDNTLGLIAQYGF